MIHKHSHHDFITVLIHSMANEVDHFSGQVQGIFKDIVKFSWSFCWLIIYAAFYISILAIIGLILFSTLISAL